MMDVKRSGRDVYGLSDLLCGVIAGPFEISPEVLLLQRQTSFVREMFAHPSSEFKDGVTRILDQLFTYEFDFRINRF